MVVIAIDFERGKEIDVDSAVPSLLRSFVGAQVISTDVFEWGRQRYRTTLPDSQTTDGPFEVVFHSIAAKEQAIGPGALISIPLSEGMCLTGQFCRKSVVLRAKAVTLDSTLRRVAEFLDSLDVGEVNVSVDST